jgi:hypothetical protein
MDAKLFSICLQFMLESVATTLVSETFICRSRPCAGETLMEFHELNLSNLNGSRLRKRYSNISRSSTA